MSRNQFGGTCYRCGKWVPAGEGHFERITAKKHDHDHDREPESAKWRVQHADCAVKYRGTPHHHKRALQP